MNSQAQFYLAEVPRLAHQITQIAARYQGRTWVVRVAFPVAEHVEELVRTIERELADRGFQGIEVRPVIGRGDSMRLLSVEFER